MITRHFLRAKALQTLYSYYISASDDAAKAEKRMFISINNVYYLEICFLSVIVELRDLEEEELEKAKGKFLPTEEDLNPNLRFVNNALINQLAQNDELNKAIKDLKVSFAEFDAVFKKILDDIKSSETYNNYMKSDDDSYKTAKNFIIKVYRRFILKDNRLKEMICEREMELESDYCYFEEFFLRFLKDYKETDDNTKPLMHPMDKQSQDEQDDEEFVRSLFRNTIAMYDDYGAMIAKRVENYDNNRVAFIDSILIKMAMVELVFCPTIPVRATINEYVELSKDFSTDKSHIFINGMLDRLMVDLRVKGLIVKSGRGLETLDGFDDDKTKME
ncbi:MAG: transcription antitermination protein NusB [Bacteroidales bacterium]|jgi:N utilization substance protein B|nr:transcription antitermination protein NusB [Bacteroidales bacterium]